MRMHEQETGKGTGLGNARKAQMTSTLIIIGLFLVFIVFAGYALIEKKEEGRPDYIGQNQLAVLETAIKAEKSLLYVDAAARISSEEAMIELAEAGGEPLKECGEYYGYNYWQSMAEGFTEDCQAAESPEECAGVQECYPGDMTAGMEVLMNSIMGPLIKDFSENSEKEFSRIGMPTYDIKTESPGQAELIGMTAHYFNIPIIVETGEEVETPEVSGAQKKEGLECFYCHDGKAHVRDLFGEERYEQCRNNGKSCCREQCPPGSLFVSNLPEYKNQHRDFRDLGACGGPGKTVSSSGCGPVSTHMALESVGVSMTVESLFCEGGENRIYKPGGTWFKLLKDVVSEHVPGSKAYWKLDFDKIAEEVRKGNPVVLDIKQKGVSRTNSLNERCYETRGHYVNIVGASDDYLVVNDPATGSRSCDRDRTVGERQVWSREFVNDISYYGVAVKSGAAAQPLESANINFVKSSFKGREMYKIEVDPSYFDVEVATAERAAGKKMSETREIMKGAGAVAAINAGFFESGGDHSSFIIENSNVVSENTKEWMNAFFVVKEKDGERDYSIVMEENFNPEGAVFAIESPCFVKNHEYCFPCDRLSNKNYCNGKSKRSVLGIKDDGTIDLIIVEGATIPELGDYLSDNYKDAIGLDGGGSVSLDYHYGGSEQSIGWEHRPACESRGIEGECQRRVTSAIVVKPGGEIAAPQNTAEIELSASEKKKVERVNQYDNLINKYSTKRGVKPAVVKAMIAWESGGDPDAISYTGCVGLGQFCYGTAAGGTYDDIFEKVTSCNCGPGKRPCSEYHECTPENDDRFNPEKNIEATAKYLSRSYKAYDGNIYLIAISYNAGPGVANIIKENLDGQPGNYENIRVLLDEAVLEYHKEKKIKEVDNHMKKVARYYEVFGGDAETPLVTSHGKTYVVRTIGEYAVNPSFSIDLPHNLEDYEVIESQVRGYGDSKGILGLAAECENEGKGSEDCVAEAVSKVNERNEMKDNKLKMFNGPCSPKENLWSDFVEDFGDCMEVMDEREGDCYCSISLNQSEQSDSEGGIIITAENKEGIRVYSEENEALSHTFAREIEDSTELEAEGRNSMFYVINKGGKLLLREEAPEGMAECGMEKRNFKFCVRSDKSLLHYDEKRGETLKKNMEYKFALELTDSVPPAPVKGAEVLDAPLGEESFLLKWDRNKEQDVSRYRIYLAESEHDVFRMDLGMDAIKKRVELKTTEVILAEEEVVELEHDILTDHYGLADGEVCMRTAAGRESPGRNACESGNNLCCMKDKSQGVVIESGKLYHVKTDEKDYYMYVLENKSYTPDYSSMIKEGVPYDIAITAVDYYGNEIDNKGEGRKLPVVREKKSKDDLPPAGVELMALERGEEDTISLIMPDRNADGSELVDLEGLNVYYSQEDFSSTQGMSPFASGIMPSCSDSICLVTVSSQGPGFYVVSAVDEAGNEREIINTIA